MACVAGYAAALRRYGRWQEGGDRMAAGEREFVYCGQRALPDAVDPLFEQCHLCAVECGRNISWPSSWWPGTMRGASGDPAPAVIHLSSGKLRMVSMLSRK